MLPALARQCLRDIEERPLGDGLLGGPPDAQQPPGRHRHGQPQACGALGSAMRVRCHCQPGALVSWKPSSIQARRPYQPAALTSGGKSVRISQGAVWPSSQPANSVQRSCRCRLLQAVPVPRQRVPGGGTKLVNGR